MQGWEGWGKEAHKVEAETGSERSINYSSPHRSHSSRGAAACPVSMHTLGFTCQHAACCWSWKGPGEQIQSSAELTDAEAAPGRRRAAHPPGHYSKSLA